MILHSCNSRVCISTSCSLSKLTLLCCSLIYGLYHTSIFCKRITMLSSFPTTSCGYKHYREWMDAWLDKQIDGLMDAFKF